MKSMSTENVSKVTKAMLSASILLLCVWLILGTFSTIAWFTDVSETKVNTFILGEVELDVNHKVDKGNGNFEYEEVDSTTEIFDDEALYEPGYTEVVYLQIKNTGTVDFDYRLSVNQLDAVLGFNEEGKAIYLPDYLRYGVIFGESEAVLDRGLARAGADYEMSLGENTFNTFAEQRYLISPGQTEYAAIVIYMPDSVGNLANYRGDSIPSVDLGITVLASQTGTIDKI